MDQSNYTHIISLARHNADIGKVKLLLAANTSIINKNVPDPYYGNLSDFENIFNIIDDTCCTLATILNN